MSDDIYKILVDMFVCSDKCITQDKAQQVGKWLDDNAPPELCSDEIFGVLVEMFMCSDQCIGHKNSDKVIKWLDDEARHRGFEDWVNAYHVLGPQPPATDQNRAEESAPVSESRRAPTHGAEHRSQRSAD
jgi:hypothetical protein